MKIKRIEGMWKVQIGTKLMLFLSLREACAWLEKYLKIG